MGEHNTDGLLVFADSLPGAKLARLHRIGFPVVLPHRSCPQGLDVFQARYVALDIGEMGWLQPDPQSPCMKGRTPPRCAALWRRVTFRLTISRRL